MHALEKIEQTAMRLLADNPDPVVRYRALRDLLGKSPDDPDLQTAGHDLAGSANVRLLLEDQESDGSWGRFHSQNIKVKRAIPTTELGVMRALALGIDRERKPLKNAVAYIAAVLDGDLPFPDRAENNPRWPIGSKLFPAAMLALLDPSHRALDTTFDYWHEVAARTFASGRYDPFEELHAHQKLSGRALRQLRYLALRGKYQLILLSSRPDRLDNNLERNILDWIWHDKSGLGYLDQPLNRIPPSIKKNHLDCWFSSLEIISRFPSWPDYAAEVIDWLWKQREPDRFWDFGPRADFGLTHYFPLSENWRKQIHRRHDWTVRVLALFRKYYDRESVESMSGADSLGAHR